MAGLKRRPGRYESWGLSLLGLGLFLGVWQVLAVGMTAGPQVLPAPLAVIETTRHPLVAPFAGHTLLGHLAASLQRFGLGFGLAALVGVPLGLAMGRFGWLDDLVTPLFEALRFVAPLAWVPFAVLWFGTGIGGPVMVIFAGAFPPCLVNAYRGARQVEARLVEAAQTLGAGPLRIIVEVLLPGALPAIVAGLRVAAGLAWQSLIGAELIVAGAGLGFVMVQAQSSLSPQIVMAAMAAVGLVGMLIDIALRRAEWAIRRQWDQLA